MNSRTFETDDIFDVPGQTLVLALNIFESFPGLNELDRQNVLGCLWLAFGFYTHKMHEHSEEVLYELIAAQWRIRSECEKEMVN